MIQVRKNALSGDTQDMSFVENETIDSLIQRAIEEIGYEYSDKMALHFAIALNGHIIDREFWKDIIILESDTVLIAPVIAGGSFGQVFKQIAIIALVAGAAAFLGPGAFGVAGLGLEGLALGLAVGASGFVGSLLLNSLIPPPNPAGGFGSSESSYEGSQMYTITSQGNTVKKFGAVPKVYGTHRLFPPIAANPYTEIEADPDTGTLVQFYYAIYDFGLGTPLISNLMIGDTSINNYSDVEYRFIDFNKPAINEGPWDEATSKTLLYYKGDVEKDGTTLALDRDESPHTDLEDYQVIRNASPKVQGSKQEISVDFVAPSGLIGYDAGGNGTPRTIELKVEFSKIGEDVWRAYNDNDYVDSYHSAGGVNVFADALNTLRMPAIENVLDLTVPNPTEFYSIVKTEQRPVVTNQFGSQLSYPHAIVTSWALNPSKIVPVIFSTSPGSTSYPTIGAGLTINGTTVGLVESYTQTGTNNMGQPVGTITIDTVLNLGVIVFELFQYQAGVPYQYVTGTNSVVGSLSLDSSSIFLSYRKLLQSKLGITAQSTSPVFSTVKFSPKEISQYKVRITRLISYSGGTYQTVDRLNVSSISTRFDRNPILTNKRHTFMELKIRATNQISGSIGNLSAIASSVLEVYDADTETWSKKVTNNPAWVYCDLLTGEVNKKAINKNRLHLSSIVEWAEFCDEVPPSPAGFINSFPRFQCNFVLDYDTTLQSVLNTVANAAQASLNIIDGKYGVLLDKLKTVPVQIFTTRNSWGFNSTRKYSIQPDALKIKYVDPASEWAIVEKLVYDDGFDEDTAETFEDLSTFACTNDEQAWRFGRYMIAQNRLRQENITINVDFEHLVCTRGDYVQITQDVMKVGGRPARVKSIVGNRITIDDAIDTNPLLEYSYKFRSLSGISNDAVLEVVDGSTFDLSDLLPSVGDIIIVGETGKVVYDCLIKSINPNSDLSATVILVEKADAIYDAESGSFIPAYAPQLTSNIDGAVAAPGPVEDLIVIDNTWRVVGNAYQYYVSIDWDTPTGAAVSSYEVYVDSGMGYNLITNTENSFYEYIVNHNNLGVEHDFKVLAVSSTGKKIDLGAAPFVSATPIKKITPPSNVEALYINITGEVIQLDWMAVSDLDIREYLIRFNPTSLGTWETSIPLLRTDANTTLASTQGRVGTYLIKALDFNGNESIDAALAITSIPNLFDLNIVDEINDFPELDGSMDQVVIDGGSLLIQNKVVGGVGTNEFYPEGYYYLHDLLDLGDIYTARIQSLIEAEGYTVTDLMANWVTLDSVSAMTSAGQADWDVECQVRTTAVFNVISEWNPISDILTMSEGDPDQWSEWRKVTIGDFTGRKMQFRFKLVSNKADVTPRVINGRIKIDMPDRTEAYNNIISDVLGTEIEFIPAFYGPQSGLNIQISQDAAESGDYYEFDYKTLDGFKITFYDKDNNPVVRQFDAHVKGYGRKYSSAL